MPTKILEAWLIPSSYALTIIFTIVFIKTLWPLLNEIQLHVGLWPFCKFRTISIISYISLKSFTITSNQIFFSLSSIFSFIIVVCLLLSFLLCMFLT